MTSPWAPRLAGRIRAAEDQVKCTSVCGRARSAVAERTTTAGIWPSVTTRGAVRGSTAAGRNRRRRPCLQRLQWNAALCRRHVGSVRMLAHDLDVDDCPDFRSPPQRMRVMERARQVQGLAGRRVRRARPSEPRAGTVTPLSVRTLTGGDVGIGRDVRPSYVQVGAGARMYGFTPRGGRALPSIRTLDNMDTHVSLETTPRSGSCVIGRDLQARMPDVRGTMNRLVSGPVGQRSNTGLYCARPSHLAGRNDAASPPNRRRARFSQATAADWCDR